ncbi:LysR substrate-binding domain-containing protein [Clostridium sp.]|uniref:LysR substrate-binding domain-containing protein n=1 Tax=Clostridium sp. TaxID=1506 RepID=UPI0025B99CC1|nr:LysR substrate-binding domain-containing protein [Clostridium sp.]MCI9069505.1 LysR family transcriptional regulator [Clostridium sp.]
MIEEFKTFIAVVDFKNFTKAAEYLNLSQPSVSTHIKNLEIIFGVTLINRSVKQKTISITESGYTLYKRAKEIINLLDVTFMDVKTLSTSIKGTIKIGASLTIGEYILPKFLAHFSNKYPDVDIEVKIENTSFIASELKKMKLDIGLIEGSVSSALFKQEYFLEDEMVLVAPFDSDLKDKEIKLDNIQNRRWIAREEGSGTREYLDLFFAQNKIIPKSIMVLGSNLAVKEAVRNNLGLTITSKHIILEAESRNELTSLKLNNDFRRSFSYIYPKELTLSKADHIFLEELKEYTKTNSINNK